MPMAAIADAAVEQARGEVAALIGADPREIVFTSGATEANNLAIKGAAHFARAHPHERRARDHIVTLATEHKCVLESCAAARARGLRASPICRSSRTGWSSLDGLAAALDRAHAAGLGDGGAQRDRRDPAARRDRRAVPRAGVLFHTDAAQAVGKIPLDVEAMQIDLLSISGHKIYGPKGVGALYVRRRPRVRLLPLFDGGGQERGLRSGTLPTPLCVGLGRAAAIAADEMAEEAARLRRLRDRLLHGSRAPRSRAPPQRRSPSAACRAISI